MSMFSSLLERAHLKRGYLPVHSIEDDEGVGKAAYDAYSNERSCQALLMLTSALTIAHIASPYDCIDKHSQVNTEIQNYRLGQQHGILSLYRAAHAYARRHALPPPHPENPPHCTQPPKKEKKS